MQENAVVLISGGSRGLGRAIVEQLFEKGCRVATFSRSVPGWLEGFAEVDPEGKRHFWKSVDISNPNAVKTFVLETYRRFGQIDGLVNNAGINLDKLLPVTTNDEIDQIMNINLGSMLRLTRDVSRIMLRQQQGSIINIGSILGHRGHKGVGAYSATKAAVDGLTRSLARELGGRGIRVNCVAPGFIETDMTHDMPETQRQQVLRRTPLGRLGRAGDIGSLVCFLLGDEAGFITGQSIVADGGLTC